MMNVDSKMLGRVTPSWVVFVGWSSSTVNFAIQCIGWHNSKEMRNAICVDTQILVDVVLHVVFEV